MMALRAFARAARAQARVEASTSPNPSTGTLVNQKAAPCTKVEDTEKG